jgi:O-antigen/teichoic acid export membrane protein
MRPLMALASQVLVYGVGPFGRRLIVYFTIPLLTAHMGIDTFGVVAVLISMFSFYDMVSNAGLPAATIRLYNENNVPRDRSITLGTSLVLFVVFALLLGSGIWLFADRVAVQFLGDVNYTATVRVIAILLLVTTLINFVQIVLRIQVWPTAKVFLDLVLICSQVAFALILVIAYGLGAFGYWFGQLVGAVLGLILAVWLIRGKISVAYSKERAKELLLYGVPLLPVAIGLWGLRLADRSLITASLGLTQVAIYEVGYKVGMIAGLLTAPFLVAWPQFAFSRMSRPDAPRTYRNIVTSLFGSTLFLTLFVISFRHELVALMAPPEYAAAAAIVPWIALSQVASAVYPVLSIGPKITKNTKLLAMAVSVAAVINVALNLLLIPRVGIMGSAIATFIGYWALTIAAYAVGNRLFPISLDWRRLAMAVLAAGIVLIVAVEIPDYVSVGWQKFSLQAMGLVLYPAILLIVGFISRTQLSEVVRIIALRLRKMTGK